MKYRIKKSKKTQILLVFGEGIAIAESLYLAMLFSHAGFDLYPLFGENASRWLAASSIEYICGRGLGFLKTPPAQPKWMLKDKLSFDFTIFIGLNEQELKEARHLLVPENSMILANSSLSNVSHFMQIPENPLLLKDFYLNVFSYVIKNLSSKQFYPFLCYSVISDIPSANSFEPPVTPLNKLTSRFNAYGLKSSEPESANILVEIISPNSFKLFFNGQNYVIEDTTNYLKVAFAEQTRIFPNLSNFDSYDRLLQFLFVELKKIQNLP